MQITCTGRIFFSNDPLNSPDGISANDTLDGGAGTHTRTTDSIERTIIGLP